MLTESANPPQSKLVASDIDPGTWHGLQTDEVLRRLRVDSTRGLSSEEVLQRQSNFGFNQLPDASKRSLFSVVFAQFRSPLIYVLFVASVTALFLGHYGDSLVILFVVLINAAIGATQESRAERSMEALQRLSESQVRVRRRGVEEIIESRKLVPGDIILLGAGDAITADARLLEEANLEVAEAALTGESNPIHKSVEALTDETLLSDRLNMLYSGTHVTSGRGVAVVVEIGQQTEVGKISDLTLKAEEPTTPLALRLEQFGRYIVWAALAVFGLVVVVGLIRGLAFFDILMIAISQMVSMVPEGLPVAMTIALAVGMQRMAHRRVIVRRLAAVETLGCINLIWSDKTGTLTRNEMTVTKIWLPDEREFEISGTGYDPQGRIYFHGNDLKGEPDERLGRLLEAVTLCNDAELSPSEENPSGWDAVGDPTEIALLTVARKSGLKVDEVKRQNPRVAELPFDSDTKLMATAHRPTSGTRICLKGAPEQILALCNTVHPASETHESSRERAEAVVAGYAAQALRVLGVAEVCGRELNDESGFDQWGSEVQFLGFVAQLDPPRDEASSAIQRCRNAGIRTIMVTGDHKDTGLAIAKQVGIAKEGDLAIDGYELEDLDEHELVDQLERVAVFARVYPAQKLRIVKALQSSGGVVAMTGDGVNDAPALAAADAGVAMGITGTDVAKGASEVVITDDNFATIVDGVEEGRLVYANLKKVVLYLFATSMAEVTVLLGALFLGMPLPLAAVQILWINIVTEGTVTVNLIMEHPEGDEMERPPIPKEEAILDRGLLSRVFLMTPTMAVSTLGYFAFCLSIDMPLDLARTETFTVLAACQWFNVLNCRSQSKTALSFDVLRNRWLLGGLIIGVLLQGMVVYVYFLNQVFHTTEIPSSHLIPVLGAASTVLWVEELRKCWRRRFSS